MVTLQLLEVLVKYCITDVEPTENFDELDIAHWPFNVIVQDEPDVPAKNVPVFLIEDEVLELEKVIDDPSLIVNVPEFAIELLPLKVIRQASKLAVPVVVTPAMVKF